MRVQAFCMYARAGVYWCTRICLFAHLGKRQSRMGQDSISPLPRHALRAQGFLRGFTFVILVLWVHMLTKDACTQWLNEICRWGTVPFPCCPHECGDWAWGGCWHWDPLRIRCWPSCVHQPPPCASLWWLLPYPEEDRKQALYATKCCQDKICSNRVVAEPISVGTSPSICRHGISIPAQFAFLNPTE